MRIRRGRTFIRVLALGAVFNVAMMVFFLGFNTVNEHADITQPTIPSYFENDMCGLGAHPPCERSWWSSAGQDGL